MASGTPGPDVLVCADLTVRFGGLVAVDGVSLAIPEGSICGLIGPNGAGKTTLFGAVGGFLEPASGRVFFRDRDVTGWPAHRRAQAGMGRTFQRLELFGHLSVIENLLVACEVRGSRARLVHDLFALPRSATEEAASRARAEEICELVGLTWARDREARTLPLGAGRLLEIGRALATNPILLMLDEPSSGLDPAESAMLAGLIRRLRDRGTSILVVEHDVAFVAELCDEVFVLDFGRLIAQGTPDEVRRDPAVRAAWLGEEERAS